MRSDLGPDRGRRLPDLAGCGIRPELHALSHESQHLRLKPGQLVGWSVRGGQALLGNTPVVDGLRDCPTVRGYALRHCRKTGSKEPLIARHPDAVLELP